MDAHLNPLVDAANPLLNALEGIRHLPAGTDTARLRQQLIDAMRNFELRGQRAQVPYETLIAARYCLCTVVDEAASLTPWGREVVWPRSGLLVTFHNETWGGEKFFQILARLSQNPKENLHLLELLNYCLLLGFEGRYRIVDGGASQLDTLKQRLVQLIRSARGGHPLPLSPNAFDPAAAPRRWRPLLPLWAFALGVLVIASAAFIALRWQLDRATRPVVAAIERIALPGLAPAPVKLRISDAQTLKTRLQPEIDKRFLDVREENGRAVVVLRGDAFFASGSDALRPAHRALMQRVAQALDQVEGRVLVLGYTDSDPIATARFASNQALSLARANAVERLLKDFLLDTNRIASEGRGESNPVAPNDSAANKALNRRVEIVLQPTRSLTRAQRQEAPDHA